MVRALDVRTFEAVRKDAQAGLGFTLIPEGQPDVDPVDIYLRMPVVPGEPLDQDFIVDMILIDLARLTWKNYRRHVWLYSEVYVGPISTDDHDVSISVRAYFELR